MPAENHSAVFIRKEYNVCKHCKVVNSTKSAIISSLETITHPMAPSYWLYEGQMGLNYWQKHRQFSLYNGRNSQSNWYSKPKITTPITRLGIHEVLSAVTNRLGYNTYARIQTNILFSKIIYLGTRIMFWGKKDQSLNKARKDPGHIA
jgi:hypothetical protein